MKMRVVGNDLKTETFLENVNGSEFSEIKLTRTMLLNRFKYASDVKSNKFGYEFTHEAFDKSKNIKVELIHVPKNKRITRPQKNEDYKLWVYKIFGETYAN